jgi:hypothetical protein
MAVVVMLAATTLILLHFDPSTVLSSSSCSGANCSPHVNSWDFWPSRISGFLLAPATILLLRRRRGRSVPISN